MTPQLIEGGPTRIENSLQSAPAADMLHFAPPDWSTWPPLHITLRSQLGMWMFRDMHHVQRDGNNCGLRSRMSDYGVPLVMRLSDCYINTSMRPCS